MRPRPGLHETEAETKTSYCETETETKKVVFRPRWSRDLNIPGFDRYTVIKELLCPTTEDVGDIKGCCDLSVCQSLCPMPIKAKAVR